jgi:hypothetical protein
VAGHGLASSNAGSCGFLCRGRYGGFVASLRLRWFECSLRCMFGFVYFTNSRQHEVHISSLQSF